MNNRKNDKWMVRMVIVFLGMAILISGGLLYKRLENMGKGETLAYDEPLSVEEKTVYVEPIIPSNQEDGLESETLIDDRDHLDESADMDLIEPLITIETSKKDDIRVTEESMEVPMAIEPGLPEDPQPYRIPTTNSDLTNPDVVPTYSQEEVTYVPEAEPEMVEAVESSSNLVPDSENPFLQPDIPSNGDRGEVKGEDLYQDGVPAGQGDKF